MLNPCCFAKKWYRFFKIDTQGNSPFGHLILVNDEWVSIDQLDVERDNLHLYSSNIDLAYEDINRCTENLHSIQCYHALVYEKKLHIPFKVYCNNYVEFLKIDYIKFKLLRILIALSIEFQINYLQCFLHVLLKLCYLIPFPLTDISTTYHLLRSFLMKACPHFFLKKDHANTIYGAFNKTFSLLFHELLQFHFPKIAFSIDRLCFTSYWNLDWFDTLCSHRFKDSKVCLMVWYTILSLSDVRDTLLSNNIRDFVKIKCMGDSIENTHKNIDFCSNSNRYYKYEGLGVYIEILFLMICIIKELGLRFLKNENDSEGLENIVRIICGCNYNSEPSEWDLVFTSLGCDSNYTKANSVSILNNNALDFKSPILQNVNNYFNLKREWTISIVSIFKQTPLYWIYKLFNLNSIVLDQRSKPFLFLEDSFHFCMTANSNDLLKMTNGSFLTPVNIIDEINFSNQDVGEYPNERKRNDFLKNLLTSYIKEGRGVDGGNLSINGESFNYNFIDFGDKMRNDIKNQSIFTKKKKKREII